MTGTIFDIKRFAIHDGPGIRTSVFLKGCPLKCVWCQNPEGIALKPVLWYFNNRCIGCGECIKSCPENALSTNSLLGTSFADKVPAKNTLPGISTSNFIVIDHNKCTLCGICTETCPSGALTMVGEQRTTEWVVEELLKDKVFYKNSGGGITLTGGDPLFQPEFSISILKSIQEHGIHTAVETSMFGAEETLFKFIPYTDLFLVDIKHLNDKLHQDYTGVGTEVIKNNFESLASRAENILVRVPLIPGYTAVEENIITIRDYVASVRNDIPIELLNFNPLARDKYSILGQEYPLSGSTSVFSNEEMEAFNRLI